MAARQLIAAAAVAALAATAVGCGGDDPLASSERQKQIDAYAAGRRAKVEQMVKEGKLPRQALQVVGLDGTINPNFIDGPHHDHDVVRTGPGGMTGKKLVFDLDHDGRIERSERTITERDLYEATVR